MQNKKVGVVIPIYNVAEYLRECLDSVINQTYKNLSIVLVNDGSTDNNESLNIAKEYVAKDSRFILIDKENGGQSTARNVGIAWFNQKYKTKFDSVVDLESQMTNIANFVTQDNKDQDSNSYHVERSETSNIDSATDFLPTDQNDKNLNLNNAGQTINHTTSSQHEKENIVLYSYNVTNENPYNIYTIYASSNVTQKTESIYNINTTHTANITNNNDFTLQPQTIDYIIFLDSDDYWKPYTIEECIKHSDGVDIVWFDFLPFYENGNNKKWGITTQEYFEFQGDTKLTGQEWSEHYMKKNVNGFYCAVFSLIDFVFLKSIGLHFLDGVIFEDHNFGCLLFLQAKNIYVLKDKPYLYRIRDHSTTNKRKNTPIPYYAKHIYDAFSDKEMAKQYHKQGCFFLMFLEWLEFIEKQPHKNQETIKQTFLPFYATQCEFLVTFPHDPLNLIPKLLTIEPYLKKGFKYRHKLRITNPAKYNRLKPLFAIYDSIKSIERTMRILFKKEIKVTK